ncbi:probable 2-oxoglutarate-dependent dioxygenase AOP1 isoform X1 [Cynara cardunculus var. scolymus]|uniref:probable 2-oxoglutarate-dependent dioxygenase AOP1 isoform X1 n=1 Tax=Cynara cardunculus var. scolymus TaxID=59895 RepID=UPI000D62771B|nr:probable 2-oxoglutarate-dependent dioxygenase AOP1 isoform X1 [Cynara cardunculus var. scolymus]
MGSEASLRLPFIDFSNVDPNTNALGWDLTKSRVHEALEEFGCFEASLADISPELQTSIFDSLQLLFDLPLQTKLKNRSLKPFHGYVGQYPMVPLYESMGIDDAPVLEKAESFTKILWPEGNPKFCTTIQEFSENLSKLDQMVRMMVLESLGLEKYMVEHMGSTNYLLRVMKYKGPETNEPELGLNAHTDKNTLTILHQNQVDGLEVQTKSGDWIKVQPSPNSFIVMIGDSFYAWTNGRLHSPYHRVMMSGEKARYSLGLFSIPKAGYVIKAPEEVVDEQHPLLFKPFDHVDFLQFYYTEAGQRAQSALKTYCGT